LVVPQPLSDGKTGAWGGGTPHQLGPGQRPGLARFDFGCIVGPGER
jgi:hypothetical protein